MTTIVFSGPTISVEEIRTYLPNAICLPPASQGDILRACAQNPRTICLIDGYFGCVPSVWHKEILWAMEAGIHMVGAASMGALRAAELAAFGMVGIGAIYDEFRSGRLTDDDEVAILHGPSDLQFMPVTDALVNIRSTVARAKSEGLISEREAKRIVSAAKSIHFSDRKYENILSSAFEAERAADLFAALKKVKVDQKRRDAIHAIKYLREVDHSQRYVAKYVTNRTVYLEEMLAEAGALYYDRSSGAMVPISNDQILDEIKLQNGTFSMALKDARLRKFGAQYAAKNGYQQQVEGRVEEVRRRYFQAKGVTNPRLESLWLRRQCLSESTFSGLMLDTALAIQAWALVGDQSAAMIFEQVKLDGLFDTFVNRAIRKSTALKRAATAVKTEEAMSWYCQKHGLSDEGRLRSFMASNGFLSKEDLFRIVVDEYAYMKSRALRGICPIKDEVTEEAG
ncbi:TfuA-like protein [Mesorhizobium sp. M1328]|uniref:TfuA-like protein n=1 Tax=Mesorhizobium sp. M1328 TaxID=2957082 RepID=UPI003338ADD9